MQDQRAGTLHPTQTGNGDRRPEGAAFTQPGAARQDAADPDLPADGGDHRPQRAAPVMAARAQQVDAKGRSLLHIQIASRAAG